MSDIVERVARALQDACVGWEDDVRQGVAWPMLARAAIEAMRDPPEYVLDAMNPSKRYASIVIPEAWNDAIDAALLDRE